MSSAGSAPRAGRAVLPRWSLLFLLPVVLALALLVAQLGWVTPVDPVRGTAQTDRPVLLWVTGAYGSSTSQVVGNHSVNDHTLVLNTLASAVSANASYAIPFPEAYDLSGHTVDYTLWIPATMLFVRNDSPLRCTLDGREFSFQPSYPQERTEAGTILFGPAPNQTERLPGLFSGFLGNYLYVPFTASAIPPESTLNVSISVPASAEITLPNIVVTATPPASSASLGSASERGWLVLPILVLGAAALVWFVRKLGVAQVAVPFTVGIGLRLALAPLFLHTDLVTLTQYPVLTYPYGIVNLQSFIYGPTWFLSLIVPAAPFYAAGVTPSTDAFNVLFKLSPIVFDGLTYLVLLRWLTSLRGSRTAYRWATFGWLFNPLVVYFSAVHGLNESAVAFFLALALYLVWRRRWQSAAVGETLAVLTLYPGVFVLPSLLALKRRPLGFAVAVLLLPVAVLGAFFLGWYRTLGAVTAYAGTVLGSTSATSFPVYGSATSTQSPWLLLVRAFGQYPSPLIGLVVVALLFFVLAVIRRPPTVETLPAAFLLAMLGFYLSYQSFFVQLIVWIIPAVIVLLALRPMQRGRSLAFLLSLSVLGLVVDFASIRVPYLTSVLSILLLTALAVPLLIFLRLPSSVRVEKAGIAFEVGTLLLALGLLVLNVDTPTFSSLYLALAVLAAVGFGVPLFLRAVRAQFTPPRVVPSLVAGFTAASSLAYLYAVTSSGWEISVSSGVLIVALLVTLVSLVGAAWSAHLWLGTDG